LVHQFEVEGQFEVEFEVEGQVEFEVENCSELYTLTYKDHVRSHTCIVLGSALISLISGPPTRVISRNFKLGGYRKKLGGVNLSETVIYTPLTFKTEKNTLSQGRGVVSKMGSNFPPASSSIKISLPPT